MEGELGGAAEDIGSLGRVLHSGQFDDDPVAAGAREGGFGDAQCVDAAAQHLQGAVGGFAVGVSGGGGAGLQHDLRAATQIESEVDGDGEGDEQRQGDGGEGEQPSDAQGAGQMGPPAGTPQPGMTAVDGKRGKLRCLLVEVVPAPDDGPSSEGRPVGSPRPGTRCGRATAG